MSGFIAMPTTDDINRLEARLAEAERNIAKLMKHGHSYAGCYGPGGQWDKTTGPIEAKESL